jgi:hypothetical protein
VGLFSGHTHKSNVIDLGSEYRNLRLAQTGAFINQESWGYRDIVITEHEIVSNYIVPQGEYSINGQRYTTSYTTTDPVKMKLGEKEGTE